MIQGSDLHSQPFELHKSSMSLESGLLAMVRRQQWESLSTQPLCAARCAAHLTKPKCQLPTNQYWANLRSTMQGWTAKPLCAGCKRWRTSWFRVNDTNSMSQRWKVSGYDCSSTLLHEPAYINPTWELSAVIKWMTLMAKQQAELEDVKSSSSKRWWRNMWGIFPACRKRWKRSRDIRCLISIKINKIW